MIKLSRWRQFILLLSWSRILPYLEANNLACYMFMDAGRRHKTACSVIKNFTSSTVNNMSICICALIPFALNSHRDDKWEPRYTLRIIVEDQWAWGIHSFYSKQWASLLFVKEEMLPHLSRLYAENIALKNGPGEEQSGLLIY